MSMIADLFAKISFKTDKKSLGVADKAISGLKVALAGFVGFKAVQGLANMVKSTASVADHARKAGQRLGITTEAVQELTHAAGLSGTSFDAVSMAMQRLAKDGSKDVEGDFGKLADQMASMPDGAAKTALAIKKFGKSGAELIPMLNGGSKGLAEMRQEARDLGIVIDDKTGKAFEQFNDDQDRLKATLTGLKNQVVVSLLPAFQKMVDGLRSWVAENREVIKSTISGAVQALVKVMQVLGDVVSNYVVPVIRFFTENMEVTKSVLIALGIIIAAFAAKAAVAWVIAFAPVVAAVATLAAIVLLVRHLINHWNRVKSAVRGAGRAIVGALRNAWNGLKTVGTGIKKFFAETIPNAIKSAFQAAWDFVVNGAKRVANTLRNLPVLKQLGDFGEYLGGKLGTRAKKASHDGIDTFVEPGEPHASFTPPAATRDQFASLGGGPKLIRGGNINIEVSGANGDPATIAREIRRHIDDVMSTTLIQAAEAVG
jgi:hypothetical protein